MSEILEENSDIQKEEQPNVEAGGIDRLYLSLLESSTNLSQGIEPTPAPAGPPPMPERWHGTSFPKAYSLGFSSRPRTLFTFITYRYGFGIRRRGCADLC